MKGSCNMRRKRYLIKTCLRLWPQRNRNMLRPGASCNRSRIVREYQLSRRGKARCLCLLRSNRLSKIKKYKSRTFKGCFKVLRRQDITKGWCCRRGACSRIRRRACRFWSQGWRICCRIRGITPRWKRSIWANTRSLVTTRKCRALLQSQTCSPRTASAPQAATSNQQPWNSPTPSNTNSRFSKSSQSWEDKLPISILVRKVIGSTKSLFLHLTQKCLWNVIPKTKGSSIATRV